MFCEKECEKSLRIKDIIQRMMFTLGYTIIVGIIVKNLLVILEKKQYSYYTFCLAAVLIIIYCSVMYIKELFILPKEALIKRQDTLELSKQLHGIKNEELIKLLIVENYCPEIKRVYLEDEGHIRFMGNYSMHTLYIRDDGATITSAKHDSKADIEANAIMKFLVEVSH